MKGDMSKKVYFTAHADNSDFVAASHRLLEQHWDLVGDLLARKDLRQLFGVMATTLGPSFFERAAKVQEQHVRNPGQQLRTLAMELLALASFAEALSRWSEIERLDVEFREDHLVALDRQVASLSLNGEQEFFFALQHVCLGDLCSDSDRQSVLEGGRQIAVPNPLGWPTLSLMDILLQIHDSVRIAVNAEPDLLSRLHKSAVVLLKGGESVLKLETMIVQN